MKMRKVIILGLDGATFKLLDPWLERGELPAFRKVINNGVRSVLQSTIPPQTSPAIPSLYTGKNPGKHGIFGLYYSNGTPINYRSIQEPKFWDLLGEHNSLIMGLRTTFPPKIKNGIMVSFELFTPSSRSDFVYPPKYYEEVKKFYDPKKYLDMLLGKGNTLERVKYFLKTPKKEYRAFRKLDTKYDFDFSLLWIGATDTLQHRYWNNRLILLKMYKNINNIVSQIQEDYPDCNLFLISDHGFDRTPPKEFHLNRWLEKEGYLNLKGGILKVVERKLHKTVEDLPDTIGKQLLSFWRTKKSSKKGKNGEKREFTTTLPDPPHQELPGIDLRKTVCFAPQYWGIHIKDEEVPEKTYYRLRNNLIEKMNDMEDKTGAKLFPKIYKAEELYSGKFLKKIPDIIFLMNNNFRVKKSITPKIVYSNQQHETGFHPWDRKGIFIATGPDIVDGKTLRRVKIYDIAPTILHYFDRKIPLKIDGRVIKEIFKDDSEVADRRIEKRSLKRIVKSKLKRLKKNRVNGKGKGRNTDSIYK